MTNSIFSQKAATKVAAPTVEGTVLPSEVSQPLTVAQTKQLAVITEDYILNLGSDSAKGLTDLTSKVLASASSNSGGAMSEKLDKLIEETKGLSADNYKANPVKKLINKALRLKDQTMARFETAKERVDDLTKQLTKEKVGQQNDCETITALALQNYTFCKAVIEEIGQANSDLLVLKAAIDSFPQNRDFDQEKQLADIQVKYDMLEKKVVDLEASKILSMNMEPKLKLMKQGAISLVSTFNNVTERVIPLYMQQFAQYLIAERQERAAAVSDKAITMFNEAITAGSDLAAKNAGDIAKLNQRQLIDVDTLRKDHENVVNSLNTVRQIAQDARQNRQNILAEIKVMEQDTINAFAKK